MSRFHSALAVCMLTACVAVYAQSEDVMIRYQQALDLIPAGRHAEAAAAFDNLAQELTGDDRTVRYLRATALTNAALALGNTRSDEDGVLDRLGKAIEICNDLLMMPASDRERNSLTDLQGISWVLVGKTHQRAGKLFEALSAGQRAVKALPSSSHRWLGQAYTLLGEILSPGTQWKEGNAFLENAVREHEMSGDRALLVWALASVMQQHRDAGARGRASDALTKLDLSDVPPLEDLRRVHLARHAIQERRDHATALTLLEQVTNPPAADVAIEFHTTRATASLLANDMATARESIAKAKELEPDSTAVIMVELQLAQVENDAARVIELATRLQRDALKQAGGIRSNMMLPASQLATALRVQADAQWAIGQAPVALDLVRRAIGLRLEQGDERGALADRLMYVRLWQQIDPYGREEKRPPAEWRRELNELRDDCQAAQEPNRTMCLLVEARGLVIERRNVEASRLLSKMDASQVPTSEMPYFLNLRASTALDLGDAVEANRVLNAAPRPETLPPNDRQPAFELHARVRERLGDLRGALDYYRQAVVLAESTPGSATLSFQAAIGNSNADLFDATLAISWQLGRGNIQDRSEMVDLVLRATMPPAPITRTPLDKDLELALTSLAGHRFLVRRMPSYRRTNPENALSDELLRENFNREYAEYFAQISKSALPGIRERGNAAREALEKRSVGRQVRLYYMGRRLGLCLVWQGGKLVRTHRFSPAQIREIQPGIERWRDAIVLLDDEEPESQQTSRRLAELLFPEGWRASPSEIQIVSHGALWRLPFETLVVSKPGEAVRYLDEDRSIVYTTPVSLTDTNPTTKPRAASGSGYFLLYPELDESRLDLFPAKPTLPASLRAAGIPASRILTGASATEERLYTPEIARAPWVHFTTHTDQESQIDPQLSLLLTSSAAVRAAKIEAIPNLKFLVTSDSIDFRSDGSLSVRDVQTLDLGARLVFLFGCQSLRGGVGQSVGIVGLGSALLVAGAENVIASHWNVPADGPLNDEVAAFYSRFHRGSVESNLRTMRASLRKVSTHPYTWGAFSLIN